MNTQPAGRSPSHDVDDLFLGRWSPRAFSGEPVPRETLAVLFEAARWAPSSFNEQPWLFLFAVDTEDHARYAAALVEGNRVWAARAPVLAFLFANRRYARNQSPNRHSGFDAGAAWMSLALQARMLGLSTHAMGGFDAGAAHAATGVPEDAWEAMAALAIGRQGDSSTLPEPYRDMEAPSGRKPHGEVAVEGRLTDPG